MASKERTAVDVILEGVSNGSITREDAKILLEAIIQKIKRGESKRELLIAFSKHIHKSYRLEVFIPIENFVDEYLDTKNKI